MDGTNSDVESSGETKPVEDRKGMSLGSIDATSFTLSVGVSGRFELLLFAKGTILSLGAIKESIDGSGETTPVPCTDRLSLGGSLDSIENMMSMLTNGVSFGS